MKEQMVFTLDRKQKRHINNIPENIEGKFSPEQNTPSKINSRNKKTMAASWKI